MVFRRLNGRRMAINAEKYFVVTTGRLNGRRIGESVERPTTIIRHNKHAAIWNPIGLSIYLRGIRPCAYDARNATGDSLRRDRDRCKRDFQSILRATSRRAPSLPLARNAKPFWPSCLLIQMFCIGRERRTRSRSVEPAGSCPTLVNNILSAASFY